MGYLTLKEYSTLRNIHMVILSLAYTGYRICKDASVHKNVPKMVQSLDSTLLLGHKRPPCSHQQVISEENVGGIIKWNKGVSCWLLERATVARVRHVCNKTTPTHGFWENTWN